MGRRILKYQAIRSSGHLVEIFNRSVYSKGISTRSEDRVDYQTLVAPVNVCKMSNDPIRNATSFACSVLEVNQKCMSGL
jgi:hypothetical protein